MILRQLLPFNTIPPSSSTLYTRGLFSPPPPPESIFDVNPTLLVSWWATLFSFIIILTRLAGRWVRTERMFTEDIVMALAIIPLFIRMGLVHKVLHDGTNNVQTDGLTMDDIDARIQGSKLVLASRIFYAMYLWVAKLAVASFLQRIFSSRWKKGYNIGIQAMRWFLLITFIAVVISTLAECQPFNHYWQVVPDPGPQCRQGYAQLLTMGITDILTDLVLVIFPVTIILSSAMRLARKIKLSLLFALSLLLVGFTIYRIYGTIATSSDQRYRSLLASIDILAATGVANAITLGSFVRDRGIKKNKFKGPNTNTVSIGSSVERPAAARTRQQKTHLRGALSWGSDIDLVAEHGMRLGPELRDFAAKPVRKALQVAPPSSSGGKYGDEPRSPGTLGSQPVSPYDQSTRRMSFFDVGGLLGELHPSAPTTSSSNALSSIGPPIEVELDEVEPLSSLTTTAVPSRGGTSRKPSDGNITYTSTSSGHLQPTHMNMNGNGNSSPEKRRPSVTFSEVSISGSGSNKSSRKMHSHSYSSSQDPKRNLSITLDEDETDAGGSSSSEGNEGRKDRA